MALCPPLPKADPSGRSAIKWRERVMLVVFIKSSVTCSTLVEIVAAKAPTVLLAAEMQLARYLNP